MRFLLLIPMMALLLYANELAALNSTKLYYETCKDVKKSVNSDEVASYDLCVGQTALFQQRYMIYIQQDTNNKKTIEMENLHTLRKKFIDFLSEHKELMGEHVVYSFVQYAKEHITPIDYK